MGLHQTRHWESVACPTHLNCNGERERDQWVACALAERWHEYGGAVTSLIGHLGTSWSDRHAARRTQYAFERLVLQYDDLAAPRRLAVTLGLRVQPRAPRALTLPAGIDRLYVHLCDGARVLVATSWSLIGASISSRSSRSRAGPRHDCIVADRFHGRLQLAVRTCACATAWPRPRLLHCALHVRAA